MVGVTDYIGLGCALGQGLEGVLSAEQAGGAEGDQSVVLGELVLQRGTCAQ